MKKSIIVYLILCGILYADAQVRVVGGTVVPTEDTQWEPIGYLHIGGFACGASLIAPQWILTAAHCVTDEEGALRTLSPSDGVRLGSYDYYQTTDYGLSELHVHANYNTTTLDNDIALIKLSTEASGIALMRIIDSQMLSDGDPSWVAGWGTTSYGGNGSTDLIQAPVPVIKRSTCNLHSHKPPNENVTK